MKEWCLANPGEAMVLIVMAVLSVVDIVDKICTVIMERRKL